MRENDLLVLPRLDKEPPRGIGDKRVPPELEGVVSILLATDSIDRRDKDTVGNRVRTLHRAPRVELFDLVSDPEEREDVAAAHGAEVAALRAALDAWRTAIRQRP